MQENYSEASDRAQKNLEDLIGDFLFGPMLDRLLDVAIPVDTKFWQVAMVGIDQDTGEDRVVETAFELPPGDWRIFEIHKHYGFVKVIPDEKGRPSAGFVFAVLADTGFTRIEAMTVEEALDEGDVTPIQGMLQAPGGECFGVGFHS